MDTKRLAILGNDRGCGNIHGHATVASRAIGIMFDVEVTSRFPKLKEGLLLFIGKQQHDNQQS